ncbi:MAG: hypothetical protein AAF378_02260 [Cyanobacteria bacterium P01_A01_bin.84]
MITGTVLIFTNFTLPASALKINQNLLLDSTFSQANTELKTSKLKNKNEDILIARKLTRREWERERKREWKNRRRRELKRRREERKRWEKRRSRDRRYWERDVIIRPRDRDRDRYENRGWERDIRVAPGRGWEEYEYNRDRRIRRSRRRRLREIERVCLYERPRGRRWKERCRQIRKSYRRYRRYR